MTDKSKHVKQNKTVIIFTVIVALLLVVTLGVWYVKHAQARSSAQTVPATGPQQADASTGNSEVTNDSANVPAKVTFPAAIKTAPTQRTEPATSEQDITTEPETTATDSAQTVAPSSERIREFPQDAKLIALTYDDGPTPGLTERILETLTAYNGRATFFMVGMRVESFPDIPKKVIDQGSEIGNHSWNHPDLTTLSADQAAAEINRTNDIIERTSGVRPVLMRPPYGAHNEAVRAACGMPAILWNIDTLDWQIQDADNIISRLRSDLHPGCVVLMHSLYNSTVEATERIVPELVKEGYTLCTVSELAHHYGVTLGPTSYFSGK